MRRAIFRVLLIAAAAGILAAGSTTAAREQQTPQFRSGTDIVPLDFLAYGPNGMPVTDLKLKDVQLFVDGRPREIKSFQFVRLASTSVETPTAPPILTPPYASNEGDRPGRSVIIVIDHEQIRMADSRPAIDAAKAFVDKLTPVDRVAVVTLPNGKVETDFTTNHDRAKKALDGVVGHAMRKSSFWNITLSEALLFYAEVMDPDKILSKEVLERECKDAPEESSCRTNVTQEALRMAREQIRESQSTLTALKEFLNGLGSVEAPTAVLFVSGTLVSFPDTIPYFEDAARAASRGRVQMYVIQPHEPMLDAQRRDSTMTMTKDADARIGGLRDLAGMTGGEFVRLTGTGIPVMSRIADELSSHYLLGFEPRSGEQDGKPHKIKLETTRRDVTIRVRPSFIADDPKRAPPTPMVLETLLRQTNPLRDLPLRATAYTFRDTDPSQTKVVVALEPAEPGTTLTSAAFALIDVGGKSAAQWSEEGASVVLRPLVTAAAVPTGDYRLRIAAMDTTGRRGTVDYEFRADVSKAGSVSFGTVMAGWMDRGNFRPRLVFDRDALSVTGYMEFYSEFPSGSQLSARFELAKSENGPAVATAPGSVLGSSDSTRYIATGSVSLAGVVPGDYVLKALIFVNNKPVGTLVRTIRRGK